jgi:hypothetical protein
VIDQFCPAMCRSTFGNSKALKSGTSTSKPRRGTFVVQSYVREWPVPEFIEEVKEAFPDKGVATPDEARVSVESFQKTGIALSSLVLSLMSSI